MKHSVIKNIGIIGAGLAGLSTAKILRQFGFNVVLFERAADIGGVWSASRRYPGLTTQNPRETYEFSDFPMPRDYPEWPTGAQMQSYLECYVDHFGFRDSICLNSEVVATHLLPEGWRLDVRGPTGNLESIDVDYLAICNGIFSIPAIPQFPGADAFKDAGGQILHTSQYTNPEDARGRHLMVVGYGKSSCDVANAATDVAASTTVVARSLIWKIPKKLAGKLNFKHLFLNRLGEALFRYIRVQGFEAFLHGPGKPIRDAIMNSVESVISRQLQLRRVGLHPGKPLETIARSTVSLVTDGFYEKVADGTIAFHKGEISQLEPGRAIFDNGEVRPVDIIVCGTGWHQKCTFLSDDILAKVTDAQGNFRLYRSMIPTGVPRLMFNGYNSSFFSQLNAEVSALWLTDFLFGGIKLPAEPEREAYIDERLAWMEARTDGKHSKGTNIIPFSVHHMDELLAEIALPLPFATRLKHWLVVINAADYAPLTERLLRRYGKAP